MRELTVDLQDGFEDEEVVISLNGTEVFRASNVSTRYQIGLARSVKLEAPGARTLLEVFLPRKGLSKSIELETTDPIYLGISVTARREITHRLSSGPFLYA